MATIYVASKLDEVREPPAGEEFDPYRDIVYSKLHTGLFQDAVAFASTDYHECGRVEEINKAPRSGITTVVAAWEVYPDGSTSRIER